MPEFEEEEELLEEEEEGQASEMYEHHRIEADNGPVSYTHLQKIGI